MDAWWQRWFAWRDEAGPLAPVVYDPWLVALSLVIACAGGVAAMQLVSLARRADRFGPAVAHGAYACGCTRGPARRDGPACARWCRCCRRSSASASTESRCINRAT